MTKLRIILPTYNECDNLKKLIPNLFDVLKENKFDADVLIIDDNSSDNTYKLVKKLKEKYPIKFIRRKQKMGIGSAYVLGFKKSIKDNVDIIFEMDADLSHKPEYIIEFVKKINQGFDVVIGEREKIVGWSFYRKIVSRGGNLIGRFIAGVKINDLTTGFRAYKKEVLEKINIEKIESDGYAFQLEMLYRAKCSDFKIGAIPIIFYNRKKGKSKLSKKDMINFVFLSFKIRLGFIDL